jgi:alkyl sulfatase BDS1-like metallo-beta-lactamase superfamily hydrolase
VRPIIYTRSMRQFGTFLSEADLVNAGIGPRLRYDPSSNTVSIIRPNKTFSGDSLDVEIAGLKLHLAHAPGETPDQIYVWLPDKKALLCADNYYKSFPNLYAIRGTSYRDVMDWVRSLDKMRTLQAEYLVPSHTKPIQGKDKIYEILTNYRDAIQFVHDQTVRGMNQGLTPDQLVERVKLPQHLARQPYLHEYYGTVAWSVRSIFTGYLGWFNGNPTELDPLSPKERAKRFADLAGGKELLIKHAKKAVENSDYQWALVLTDQLLELDPELKEAIDLRASALKALGEHQISANGRHYYLTKALELQNKIKLGQAKVSKEVAYTIPLKAIFSSMAVNLDPVKSAQTDTIVGFRFPDTGETYTVHVRKGVAEIQPRFPDNPSLSVTVDSPVWKEIAARIRSPALAYAKGEVKIEGGVLNLVEFLGLFKSD